MSLCWQPYPPAPRLWRARHGGMAQDGLHAMKAYSSMNGFVGRHSMATVLESRDGLY